MKVRLLLYYTLALLSIFFFASCQKNIDITPSQEPSKKVQISLSASLEDALRVYQIIDPATGKPIKPELLNKGEYECIVAVSVRRKGAAQPEEAQMLNFKITDSKENPRITYFGELTVPANSNLEIAAIVTGFRQTAAGGTILNLLTRQGEYFTVSSLQEAMRPNATNKLWGTLPYIADWSDLTPNNEGIFKHNFIFKPSGTLIRFRIHNGQQTPVTLKYVDVYTNAFGLSWNYDFETFPGDNNLKHGIRATAQLYTTNRYALGSQAVTLQPGATSPWYYIVGMPVKEQPTPGYITHINVVEETKAGNIYPVSYEFISNKPLDWGSVKMELNLKKSSKNPGYDGVQTSNPKYSDRAIPLMYVTRTNMTGAVDESFTLAPNNLRSSFMTYTRDDIKDFIGSSQTIGDYEYIVPTYSHWNGILFDPKMPINFEAEAQDRTYEVKDTPDSRYSVGRASQDDNSQYYKRAGETTIYGFRFLSVNTQRTAYRYRMVTKDGEPMLEVTSRYLGMAYTGNLNHISRDAFWDYRSDLNVVRYFPFTEDELGLYEGELPPPTNQALTVAITPNKVMRSDTELTPYKTKKMAVRLFRAHPIEDKPTGHFSPY